MGLVLTRRRGERVVTTTPEGRQLVIEVVHIGEGKVRLHFSGDRDVEVHREEVAERMGREVP